ncbi:MAG: tetratricopeptide repeat protein, partial [Betaproteobacteria bacterium]|nr:tetratricopeptide repeat protein [Betaproteobacteria bacterium]
MRELRDVTLACIDTANHALALRALELSRRALAFGRTLLLTDAIPAGIDLPPGIDVVAIERLASRDDYSRFVLKSLLAQVATRHVLLVQWDGYVVNPEAFDDAFLATDYIGAKWFWYDDAMRVGNGGFSLRSRKLLEALQDPRITLVEAEDVTICRAFRPLLEREHAIRYASEALADRFAFEAAYPAGMPFGFHGLYNFCRVVAPDELAALAPRFSDAIAASPQLGQLIRNCIALGQWAPAAALARRRLAVLPNDAEAQALLARAEAGLAQGPVVGRNDPCPCGSGKRYKQCHGALGGPATGATRSGVGSGAGAAPTATAPPSSLPQSTAPSSSAAAALAQQGIDAHRRGDVDAAERAYRAALTQDAEQPLALHYLGVVLYQRGRPAEALPLLERAAALVPREPEFHNNLGLALAALDRNDDAVAAYRRSLAQKPDHATAWNNLGLALQAMNRLPEAIEAYRRALAYAPAFAHAHWNLALALLAHGDEAEGWREYEWRLSLPELGGRAGPPPAPRWQGEDLAGKTLLLTTEQGLGDAIHFVRYASALAARGARVVVQTPPALQRLLASAPGVASTITADDAPPECDFSIPLLSVPGALGASSNDPDCTVPYLRVDAARRADVAARIAGIAGGSRRIGIAWSGSRQNANDGRRSIPLSALVRLFALPGIAWFSLQKGAGEEQIAQVPAAAAALALLDARNDFDGTAGMVDVLDAVVSVDTSIAHLAGALGKPVHVLLPFAPDWRWGITGDTTPWYPTARLHRQPATGDWASVIDALSNA